MWGKCVGGSAFPASFILGPAKFRASSLSPARVLLHLPPFPLSLPPLLPDTELPNFAAASLAVGRELPRVSLLSGGSAANWIVKDDPSAQLSAELGPSDVG